jgi:hypothetical protein
MGNIPNAMFKRPISLSSEYKWLALVLISVQGNKIVICLEGTATSLKIGKI